MLFEVTQHYMCVILHLQHHSYKTGIFKQTYPIILVELKQCKAVVDLKSIQVIYVLIMQ